MKKNKNITWTYSEEFEIFEGKYDDKVVFEIHDSFNIFMLYNYCGKSIESLPFESIEEAKKGADMWFNDVYPSNSMDINEAMDKINKIYKNVSELIKNIDLMN